MKLNNIKKTLDQRSITPSADSWDKLSQRLDAVAAQKQTKKPFAYWIGAVAAVLVIALVVVAQVSKRVETTNPSVVKQNDTPAIEKIMDVPVNTLNRDAQNKQELINNQPITNAVAAIQYKLQQEPRQPLRPAKKDSQVVNQSTTSVTIQNSAASTISTAIVLQESNVESKPIALKLTAAQETDLLLERAMGSLKTSRQTSTAVVHADRLLQETEWDIEADRRNRVENMLLDQFGKLKAHAASLVANK